MSFVSIYEDAKKARIEKEVNFINDIFESFSKWRLSDKSKYSISVFIECIGLHAVECAMNEAVDKFDGSRNGKDIFLYFCGVCWDEIAKLSLEVK